MELIGVVSINATIIATEILKHRIRALTIPYCLCALPAIDPSLLPMAIGRNDNLRVGMSRPTQSDNPLDEGVARCRIALPNVQASDTTEA